MSASERASERAPWRCIATAHDLSQGERRRRGKKHLITSNSCKPFWSPKVSQRLGRCVCSVSGNDLPSHEHCHVLQRRCPPAAPLNFSLTLSCLPCLRITASELTLSLSLSLSFFLHLTVTLFSLTQTPYFPPVLLPSPRVVSSAVSLSVSISTGYLSTRLALVGLCVT